MKTLKVFFVLLLTFFGACNPGPTEPNDPPESIIIVTIPFVQISTTATTAVVTSSVSTNGPVSLVVKYGVGNYNNVVGGIPTNFNLSTNVDAKLSDLVPNTKYQLRIQAVDIKNVVKFTKDTVFTTDQLKLGDVYQGWTIFSTNPLLGFKIVNEYQNWETAKITASAMGGYLPSIPQQLILFSLKEQFGLNEFTYWSSEEDKDEPNLVVTVIFNSPNNPGLNGKLGSGLKTFIFKPLVVHQF